MASTSTSNKSSFRGICKYDVFLSFRGPDTRNNFVDHLYNHLIKKGIFVFKDDQTLHKGESISPQLLQAIRDSTVSIVVFSENYTQSTWCLDEIAAIAECRRQLNRTVIPVFYDLNPSEVRRHARTLSRILTTNAKKLKYDNLGRWRKAISELCNLAGFVVRDRLEYAEIETIVQAVKKVLVRKLSGFTNDFVGMQPRIEELVKLLKLSSEDDDFRVLGIWGMGGVGKTTHANLLYDKISCQFDARSFIHNTSKIYMDGGIVAVQKQIPRQALDETNLDS